MAKTHEICTATIRPNGQGLQTSSPRIAGSSPAGGGGLFPAVQWFPPLALLLWEGFAPRGAVFQLSAKMRRVTDVAALLAIRMRGRHAPTQLTLACLCRARNGRGPAVAKTHKIGTEPPWAQWAKIFQILKREIAGFESRRKCYSCGAHDSASRLCSGEDQ